MDGSSPLRLINCVYVWLYLLLDYSRTGVKVTVEVDFPVPVMPSPIVIRV